MNPRWRIAFLISAAIAISYLDRQTLPVAIGEIRKEIPISNQIKAFLDSAFLVTYGLMYLGGGRFVADALQAAAAGPRRAVGLERPRRAARLAELRSFDQAHAGIDDGRLDVGDVRRRIRPMEAGVVPPHVAPPAAHPDDGEVAADVLGLVEEDGELADGQAVAVRDRVLPDKADEGRVQAHAFDGDAVDRIGAVEDDDGRADGRGDEHAVGHRGVEGVVARADVLEVDDEDVERGDVGRLREEVVPRVAAVHGEHRDFA